MHPTIRPYRLNLEPIALLGDDLHVGPHEDPIDRLLSLTVDETLVDLRLVHCSVFVGFHGYPR